MIIKLKIGKYMKENKITSYKLLKETNIPHQTFNNYRDGKLTRVDFDILSRIATALKIKDINDIIEIIND